MSAWESMPPAAPFRSSTGGARATAEAKPSKSSAGLFAVRILALFAVGYVMVKYLSIDPRAGIAGLFASSAAVIVEILLELAAGRRLT